MIININNSVLLKKFKILKYTITLKVQLVKKRKQKIYF